MRQGVALDKIRISVKAHRLLWQLLEENPRLERILTQSRSEIDARTKIRTWVMDYLGDRPAALTYRRGQKATREGFEALSWQDYGAVRILDYLDRAPLEIPDLNLRGDPAYSDPFRLLWLAVRHGSGGAKPDFFEDMLHLFRQVAGEEGPSRPSEQQVLEWMARFPSGLDPEVVALRAENRDRILSLILDRIDEGITTHPRFRFDPGMSRRDKLERARGWWADHTFHLRFAVRSADLLNEMLDRSLDPDTMVILHKAEQVGIPFFVNPYYLSLLNVRAPSFAVGADLAIRQYVLYSQKLVDEFGHIVAWEKEDAIQPGRPNEAGWLLPNLHCVHRRYPDVAILIPETMGRACGGLCTACQRMFDFQSGHLNFDLGKLRPRESWPEKLGRMMRYFEQDTQLRDILITGGDALMSSVRALEKILDAVCEMAGRKREANASRPDGQKYAEMSRVRLGTRLPAYLPMRITKDLTRMLERFKVRARKAGIQQFVIQTHFESPMEVTPECRDAIQRLLSAGWIVTNQLVFTAAASRRGHTARLRQVLNDVGVLPYYTFSVKGYMENHAHFATNARAVQEQMEEKVFGLVPPEQQERIRGLPEHAESCQARIESIRSESGLPFLATDRNVLNLPGVGKSLTFRVIGITRYGRRILEFDHDSTRYHSPIIEKMGKVIIIESKSMREYLDQLEEMGEDPDDYASVWGYSMGETEPRMSVYEYPACDDAKTDALTHFDMG
ncbi:MAG: KamA family protein [Deltaproteobacteria bacterium]|nr:KamA family protein [Deltaproteobacteria bacterium]